MIAQQHICGAMVNVEAYQTHGQTILYVETLEGQQIDHCPECGEELIESSLFALDIFPQVQLAAEMAESLIEE